MCGSHAVQPIFVSLISFKSCPGECRWSPPSAEPKPKAAFQCRDSGPRTALRSEPRADEATSFYLCGPLTGISLTSSIMRVTEWHFEL